MDLFSLPHMPPGVYIGGVVSFLLACFLVLTKHWHAHFSMDGILGVQRSHNHPTPRIGGLAIYFGVAAAWFVADLGASKILGLFVVAGLPAFAFGLAEDVTKRVQVLPRLLATMSSGVVGWWLTGYSLREIGVPYLDALFFNVPFSVLFTAFAVGGLANAVNIIDGLNGLASGFVAIALAGLSAVAALVGDFDLAVSCLAVGAAMVGFWLINWPWGKLFLGDGGSYFGGVSLAWACVLLVERNPGVTPFVPLLICIHPITEVLFSIYRRRQAMVSPGAPDRLHLHSLAMRRMVYPSLVRLLRGNKSVAWRLRNPVTGFLIASMSLPPMLLAVFALDSTLIAIFGCLAFFMIYRSLYSRLVQFRWATPTNLFF